MGQIYRLNEEYGGVAVILLDYGKTIPGNRECAIVKQLNSNNIFLIPREKLFDFTKPINIKN